MADLSVEGVGNLKVNDLKKELKARSLSVAGTKSELSSRLVDFLGKGGGDRGGADENLTPEDEELLNDPAEDAQPKGSVAASLSPAVADLDKTAAAAVATSPTTSQAASKPDVAAAAAAGGLVKKAVADVKSLSAEERLKLRQQKFNVVAAGDKKEARAKRFGLPQTATPTAAAAGDGSAAKAPAGAGTVPPPTLAASLEKLKQRRERFGQAVSDTIKQVEATERILKRKQRFGAVAPAAVTADVEEKKKKREQRFGAKVAS